MDNVQLEERKIIWQAISNFYLDTELQASDYEEISTAFMSSHLTVAELKNIDQYEVFPTLQANLLSPIGVWTGFDKEWLSMQCLRNHSRRSSILFTVRTRIWHKLWFWMREDHWKEVEKRMKKR